MLFLPYRKLYKTWKNKNWSGTSLHASFCVWFFIMTFILYFFKWPNFILLLSLFLEILDNICNVVICFQVCDFIIFWDLSEFLIKPFFYITKMSRQNFCVSHERKKLLLWNEKHFSSFLKSFLLSEIVSDPRVNL